MSDSVKIIDTKTLFKNENKVIQIVHNGSIYILRITKDNKLILTK